MKERIKQTVALVGLYVLLNVMGMTWNTLTNLTAGQLVTETHMDNIRENIEHLGDNILIGGVDAKTLTTTTSAARMATGTYTGDGNATQAITGVGFQPDFIEIYPEVDGSISAGFFHKSDQDGTKTAYFYGSGTVALQYEDDFIISMDSDGFTVGDGTGSTAGGNILNVNLQVHTFVAWIA